MRKIRILAVAPYPEMKQVFETVTASRNDISLQVIVGNTTHGEESIRNMDLSPFDVIISRGGTADLIRSATSLPVIEVELTPYDIQNALTGMMEQRTRFAIVGYPGITNAATTYCDVMGVNVDVFTIHDKQGSIEVLQRLKSNGIDKVLCDMEGLTTAKEVGIDAELIMSSARSIEKAISKGL